MTNTLDYYYEKFITAYKSFILHAPGEDSQNVSQNSYVSSKCRTALTLELSYQLSIS